MYFPKNTKKVIDDIRAAIGRVVTFIYEDGYTTCTLCSLDPTTGLSTNSFCPVCSGNYYIPNILHSGIIAHVTWNRGNEEQLTRFGLIPIGDVRVQIEYTDEHSFIVDRCVSMEVDGRRFEVFNYDLRGVPSLNRIVIYGRQLDDAD